MSDKETPLPAPVNQTASAVNTVVNDVVQGSVQLAEHSLETLIETQVPIFALPVIKQVEEFTIDEIVGFVGNKISIGLQQVGTYIVIDTQVNSEKKGVSKALADLMMAEKSGDPQRITDAIKAYADAQSALIHDDGSAPAHT